MRKNSERKDYIEVNMNNRQDGLCKNPEEYGAIGQCTKEYECY